MCNKRNRHIRIIKHGTPNDVLMSKAAIRQREEQAEDPLEPLIRGISGWVTEFKERRRPNAKSRFEALFKET